MPQGRSGARADSGKYIWVDAGAVYLNYGLPGERLLGATRDGNSFTPGRTIREIPVDGALGPVKGFRRRERVAPQITCNLLELTVENLLHAIAGATSTKGVGEGLEGYDIIKGGPILDEAYIPNVALVGTIAGSEKPIVCIIKNALADAGLDLETAPQDEVVPSITFTGHFGFNDVTGEFDYDEPWEIRYPEVGGETEDGGEGE